MVNIRLRIKGIREKYCYSEKIEGQQYGPTWLKIFESKIIFSNETLVAD